MWISTVLSFDPLTSRRPSYRDIKLGDPLKNVLLLLHAIHCTLIRKVMVLSNASVSSNYLLIIQKMQFEIFKFSIHKLC